MASTEREIISNGLETVSYTHLDVYKRQVKWELSDTFDNFLVMKPAERLLKRKMSTEHQVLLHSDQGVQYSSAGYCNLLKEYNVIQSMSRAGDVYKRQPFAIVLPLNVGNICFYDTNGNVVEYLRQQL